MIKYIENYIQEYWGTDLRQFKVPVEIVGLLPESTIAFLEKIGLPTNERVLQEKKTFLRAATIWPENITDDVVKITEPIIAFAKEPKEIGFEGKNYVSICYPVRNTIGIAFDTQTGKVFYIYGPKPRNYGGQYYMPVRFMNESIQKTIFMMTIDFSTKRRIAPHQARINQLTRRIQKSKVIQPKLKEEMEKEHLSIHKLLLQQDEKMRKIEPKAFLDYRYYWRLYIEEQLEIYIE